MIGHVIVFHYGLHDWCSIEHNDYYRERIVKSEMWDSPVIATTMVQFLNTLFLDKTASFLRFHRLSKAVIIIDEV